MAWAVHMYMAMSTFSLNKSPKFQILNIQTIFITSSETFLKIFSNLKYAPVVKYDWGKAHEQLPG